ncbi:MAG: flagella basal body P-ring formation protein FlgA [Erythrobacter sp.]|jgi:flagella basal body P-ring formation protein FlgA|nr:flagella basal body P-ring formation protein FlgA [Erythrobacter sp.]
MLPFRPSRPETRSAVWCAIALAVTGHAAPASASAASAQGFLDPAEIDRAVSRHTNAAIGAEGGALAPADARLRLAACAVPLATSWHGTGGQAVRVECPATREGSQGWHIFVATRPHRLAEAPQGPRSRTARAPAIKRGDPVTVIVRGRGFSVQQAGEAMENGEVGDWIGIRTTRRAEPVRARIERPGLAIIPVG